MLVADKTIIDVAKRNIEKFDIVPLYYDMKKASPVILDNKSIYDGLHAAFVGGNIGIYSNNISKIWNSDVFVDGTIEEQKEAVELIKILCMENNFVIDYAKTLYKPTRPKEVNDKVNAFTNQPLPYFFKYAKDKTDSQIVDINGSFVNKLEGIIPNPRMNMRKLGLGKIDCSLLMRNPYVDFDVAFTSNGRIIESETDPLIVEYCKFDKKYYMNVDSAINQATVDNSDRYMRRILKNGRIVDEIKSSLSRFGRDEHEVVDVLVKFLYGIKKSSNKTALWMCYGDVIHENLLKNIGRKTRDVQCVDCGEWFEVDIFNSATERCDECQSKHQKELNRIASRERMRRYRERKKNGVTCTP